MKTLIVAATETEISPLLHFLRISEIEKGKSSQAPQQNIDVLITGVGIFNTAYILAKHLSLNRPKFILNAGIAGSFDYEIQLGEVVNVTTETFGDLGAENDKEFLSLDELNLGSSKVIPAIRPQLNGIAELRKVSAITVNKTHGNERSIETVRNKFGADIESMEGAAVEAICTNENIACLQLRSISNYIEKRDKNKWQIPLAVKNLNDFIISLIHEL